MPPIARRRIRTGPPPRARTEAGWDAPPPTRDPIARTRATEPTTSSSLREAPPSPSVPDKPGAVAHIFEPLADASINVDMIIQNVGRDKGETDVTFTVPQADLARAQALIEDRREDIGFNRIITDSQIAKISVVGVGMKSHAGVASTMFRALSDRGINIQAISTSEIKVSVLIDEDETELAVRVLHTAYGLDADDEAA